MRLKSILASLLLVLMLLVPAVPVSASGHRHHKQGHYTNVEGRRVHSPVRARSAPARATAECNDGTYSFSQNHRGTCSHHGGVRNWLR
jgi:Protein of unknown function (DUF3761)